MNVKDMVGELFVRLGDMPPKGEFLSDTIAGTSPSKFSSATSPKLDLVLASGMKLALNSTNTRELAKHFGFETNDWTGRKIELYRGEVRNQNGEWQDSVRVRAVNHEALTILRDKANSSVPAQLPPPIDEDHEMEKRRELLTGDGGAPSASFQRFASGDSRQGVFEFIAGQC
jgi:hypothetical protein